MTDYTLNKDIPLTSVQNEVIDFMLKRPACINACQTGLGKTYTNVTAIAHLLLQHKDLIAFIVAPPKALKIFRKELREKLRIKFSEISAQEQVDSKCRVFLVSQTKLSECTGLIERLRSNGFKLALILDEAHICQAEDNDFTKLIRTIRHKFPIFWLSTATPCGNDIWGLYNLMYLINPNILGSKENFTKNYLVTEYKRVKKFNIFTKRYEFPYEEIVTGYKNVDKLQSAIADYVIIRQKKYNLEFIYHKCDLDPTETVAYLDASAGKARDTSKKNWAVRVNDLQRVVDNASEKYSDSNTLSSKEKLLVNVLLSEIENHAILVYTELTDTVLRLRTLFIKLKQLGYPINNIYTITGSQTFQERAEVEDNLTKSDIVIITQAGTESINLQAADTILLYNVPFSIKVFIQLIGRVTRVDTKYPKQYIHFIEARGTVDTYRRLNVSLHGNLIQNLFGEIETLPVELTIIDNKTQQKLKSALLWSFKTRKLPTEDEIEKLLS